MKQVDPLNSVISNEAWQSLEKAHSTLMSPFADAFLKRRSLRLKHPVHDFLFTYYTFSPAKLKQWVPPYGTKVAFTSACEEEYPWLKADWFTLESGILSYNKARLATVKGRASFVEQLCKNILERPARFGCFGLHEWAMVYKMPQDALRHQQYALRLPPQALARFVESQTLCCTHYDAYRFFTPPAKPLNTLSPCLDTRLQLEQGGCLHANMDLYKWSTKLWPWIGADFIAKTFMLALKGREIDMRASPYDLTAHGYDPICIETEEGRKLYQKEQSLLAEQATYLRRELYAFCQYIQQQHG